ncbi:hypothetical protein ACFLU6_13870 [Acidobacteriota bacterium]
MKELKPDVLIIAILFFTVLCTGSVQAQSRLYTLDDDFDEGVPINVNHDPPNNDQLQINENRTTYPFIWIANSNRGTIAKVDVETGEVLGEYFSAPEGCPADPSRTTVDLRGNLWSGNRDENRGGEGSVVSIGLVWGGTRVDADGTPNPDGQYLKEPFIINNCVDRDGDGLIKTSRGLGDILPWIDVTDSAGSPCTIDDRNALVEDAEDECIRIFQRHAGVNARHISVNEDNQIWVAGYDLAYEHDFSRIDGDTGCILEVRDMPCGGYGGLIDARQGLSTINSQVTL